MKQSVNDKLRPSERAHILRQLGFKIRKDKGQINNIKNIAYEDTQPDLCINLDTGQVNDFGDPSYSGDVINLVQRTLNKDFKGTMETIEGIIGRDLGDDGIANSNNLYREPRKKKKKEPEKIVKFWSKEKRQRMIKCNQVLKKRGIVDSMNYIQTYDGITLETLKEFSCGIYGFDDYEFGLSKKSYNRKAYFAFPYKTGCMIYRRTDDGKEVKHIKGSKATQSWFNFTKDEEETNAIFLMKSPRECMNFSQYSTDWKTLGIATGENIRNLTSLQKEQLDQLIVNGECLIHVVTDCDNPEAYENSLILCRILAEYVEERATIKLVNLHKHSEGKYKDFTDMIQFSMRKENHKIKDRHYVGLHEEPASILNNAILEAEVIIP